MNKNQCPLSIGLRIYSDSAICYRWKVRYWSWNKKKTKRGRSIFLKKLVDQMYRITEQALGMEGAA
jgi:hypothetical protein